MDPATDLRATVDRCLAPNAAGASASRTILERLRRMTSSGAPKRRAGDPGVDALLHLAGIDDRALAVAERRLADGLSHVGRLGVSFSDLGVVGQAYTRGVGRIAEAESEIIRAIVRVTPEGQRSERLEALIRDAVRLAPPTFSLLHRALLRYALLDGLPANGLKRTEDEPAAIAHVDAVSSTSWLSSASRADTERLVDGLFAAAQTAVRDRPVLAVKYVGDGVFLAGREPRHVADAALECVRLLAADSDLTSRAGIAYGPVVRRAGDFFGLTVNLSHSLTKAAAPGTLLVTEPAAAELPASMVVTRRDVEVAGLDAPVAAAEVAPY